MSKHEGPSPEAIERVNAMFREHQEHRRRMWCIYALVIAIIVLICAILFVPVSRASAIDCNYFWLSEQTREYDSYVCNKVLEAEHGQ